MSRSISELPPSLVERLQKVGIDLSDGYPYYPEKPSNLEIATAVRDVERKYTDPGSRADPNKAALLGAAKEVIHYTKHIGTEIVGLQLKDLSDKQKDELALLIAERTVVWFRDQDISPQQQLELGEWFGEIEVHPTAGRVPGLPGVTVISPGLVKGLTRSFKNPVTQRWHTDLTHEFQPPGVTHLHNDIIPSLGGDTYWASGYSAYDKLSPAFRKVVDGLEAVYHSVHAYADPKDPNGPLKHIERVHPLVRIHPVTGWKSLFVNRAFTVRIIGFEPAESKVLLDFLFDVYEKSLDIQVRFKWTPKTSALWDNRVSIHAAVFDYDDEPRHGTRVSSLAERPFFDPAAPSRREALKSDE